MALERLTPETKFWKEWGHHHLQRYVFAGKYVIGKEVLDFACGAGYGSYTLKMQGATSVVGVDRDATAIKYAKSHYLRENISFEEGDALTWESSEKFDVVVSFETIEHLPSPEQFLAQIAKNLKDDGILLISAPNTLEYQKAIPPINNEFHINEPDYRTMIKWLEPHFVILGEWEQSPVTTHDYGKELSISDLINKKWVRAANKIENTVRKWLGKPVAVGSETNKAMLVNMDIIPLLPERSHECNVFLFVCRRRGNNLLK